MQAMQRAFGILLMSVALAMGFLAIPPEQVMLRWSGLACALLVTTGCGYYLLEGSATLHVMIRALCALLPVALGVFLLTVLIQRGGEPPESRIMIAAVVVAGGWVVGFITQELRRVDEREEKRRDLIKALKAEIRPIITLNKKIDWKDAEEKAKRDFASDPNFVPFLVFLHDTDVLRRVVSEINLLDRDQIDDIYAFFHLMDKIRQVAVRLESDAYSEMIAERRKDVYLRLLRMHGLVAETGEAALEALDKDRFGGLVKWR